MTTPKYSIIVPHKNSFKSLIRLLESIPEYDFIEVWVVDDNSEEETVRNLKLHNFSRNVKLIFNKNGGGAGAARNTGLREATGKWLIFADADDYFSESLLELINPFFNAKEDIIYFGTTSIFGDTMELAYRHQRYVKLVSDYLQDTKNEDALRYYFTSPCAKMIRREIVVKNNVKFDNVIASNDIYFSIVTASHARKIAATNKVLYTITVNSGSLTNSFSRNHFDSRFNVTLRANDYLRSINKQKYQLSVLYYIIKSYKFGLSYTFYVLKKVVEHRSNIFIGLNKIIKYKEVLKVRENPRYVIIKNVN